LKRAWIVIVVLVAAWVCTGMMLSHAHAHVGRLVVDLYEVGILGVPASALMFIGLYTYLGFRSQKEARWWRNPIGMAIVTPYFALIATDFVLAWAQLFHGGLLDTFTPVWIDVGGLLFGMGLLTWRAYIWLRAYIDNQILAGSTGPVQPDPTEEPG
jgi:hypothetical protein